jgi:adenylate kinase family enzyme
VTSTPTSPTRILVYGVTGAGKTTLAEQIGKHLGLPWYSVDDLTWEPGWIQVPTEIQRARIARICGQSEWVLDTAYGAWRDVPLAAADLVVGLDFPRWVSLGRLLRRTATRLATRARVCNGNRESIKSLCSTDSIIVWHFKSFKRKQRRMRQWHADPQGPRVLLFRSPAAVTTWLRGLQREAAR